MSVVSNKREKELARAKFERQQLRRQTRKKRNLLLKASSGLIVLALLIGYAVSLGTSTPEPITAPSASAIAAAPVVDGCVEAGPTRADNVSYPSAPKDLTPAQQISFVTNCGDLVVQTDQNAPNTVGILSFFAKNKFYDGVNCHRLTTDGIYVLQCGDPSGNGSGGPGFTFADENLPTADANGTFVYPRGTLAMANSGPNTNGSQFFIVYQDSPLPPNYSVWGKLTSGLEIIDAIAAAGTVTGQPDGPPAQTVVISQAITTP